MQREIKFRALHDDMTMQWRYGMLIYENGIPRIQQENTMLFSTCLKGTEGQYTGLKDKNGKEIYEGDILEKWGEVAYSESRCRWYTKKHDATINDIVLIRSFIEVIGNIYETQTHNP